MKISIIWILSDNKKENGRTLKNLREELSACAVKNELFVCRAEAGTAKPDLNGLNADVHFCPSDGKSTVEIYRDCAELVSGDYVTMLFGGDIWSK